MRWLGMKCVPYLLGNKQGFGVRRVEEDVTEHRRAI